MLETPRVALSVDLLESDRVYFEAGAEVVPVRGAVVARVRGLEMLAAACVVQRVEVDALPQDIDAWLEELGVLLRGWGCSLARIYLDPRVDHDHAPLERSLRRAGYRPRIELAVAKATEVAGAKFAVALRSATEDAGWAERLTVLERSGGGSDGHEADPALWVAMERARCSAGRLHPYLIESEGRVVGVVGALVCGNLLRIKNLLVAVEHRRRGVATETARLFARLAGEHSCSAAGCFVLADGPNFEIYRRAGYHVVAQQTEWTLALERGAS